MTKNTLSPENYNTDRAGIRQQLLADGYSPLPLMDKGPRIKGWSRDEITEEWLARYARNSDMLGTGLRCDRLIAFDIDVTDGPLANEIEGFISAECGPGLMRVGRWPKRLMLYRVEGEPSAKSGRTGKFHLNDEDHMVELLCGPGRQFAAFGDHPGTGQPYEWFGDSPLMTPLEALPAVTYAKAVEVLMECDAIMCEQWQLPASSGGRLLDGNGTADQLHDFDDSTECEVAGEVMAWGDLRTTLNDGAGVFGNLRREDGEFGDSGAVHFYLSSASGQPCVHDFARDVTHFENPIPPQLIESLPPAAEVPAVNLFRTEADAELDDACAEIMSSCVIMRDGKVRRLEAPLRDYPLETFCKSYAHIRVPDPNPPKSRPKATIPYTNIWRQSPDAMRADYTAMNPDAPGQAFYRVGSATVLNTYRPPEHASNNSNNSNNSNAGRRGSADVFFTFMEHLLPDERERGIFLDWLALKVAKPSARLHGMILVTPAYGTGRGTLTNILGRLLGVQYVNDVELGKLLGRGSQGQYNGFLADSLLVTISEALEDAGGQSSRWASRKQAYEALKTICDPGNARINIKRKYGGDTTEDVFASILVSSNHIDALAIPEGDRRLIVLDNTQTPLASVDDGALQTAIYEWIEGAAGSANIGALWEALMARASDSEFGYTGHGMPPETKAKARMVGCGTSDMDVLFKWFIEGVPGDVVTLPQWRAFVMAEVHNTDLVLPEGKALDAVIAKILQAYGRRVGCLGESGRIRVGKSQVRPWVIRNFGQWDDIVSPEMVKEEILKNGSPGGELVQFPE